MLAEFELGEVLLQQRLGVLVLVLLVSELESELESEWESVLALESEWG